MDKKALAEQRRGLEDWDGLEERQGGGIRKNSISRGQGVRGNR